MKVPSASIPNATLTQYYWQAKSERYTSVPGFKAATALRLAKSRHEYNSARGIPLQCYEQISLIGHGDYIRRNGKTYAILTIQEDDGTPPWERSEGHGTVSEWTTRDKRPGELILCEDRGSKRYYDFQEAIKIAKRDGWNSAPYNAKETKGERAVKAVKADFEFLKGWCDDKWHYIGVVLVELPKAGFKSSYHDLTLESDWHKYPNAALWGIESESLEYISETAFDLVSEVR